MTVITKIVIFYVNGCKVGCNKESALIDEDGGGREELSSPNI